LQVVYITPEVEHPDYAEYYLRNAFNIGTYLPQGSGWKGGGLHYVSAASGQAVQQRVPTSDESVAGDWSGSAGSRYTLVEDWPEFPPATYLQHGTAAGNICFGFSPFYIPAGRTIYCVNLWASYKEPVSGGNNFRGRLKVGGSYYNNDYDYAQSPDTTWRIQWPQRWPVNPKTGVAWTIDDINGAGANALEAFGINSTDANPLFYIGDVVLEVIFSDPSTVVGDGSEWIEVTWHGGTDFPAGYPLVGEKIYDNDFSLIAAVVVPWVESERAFYIYPSPSERIYHDDPTGEWEIQVGDTIDAITGTSYAKGVVTEVGDGWFKSDIAPGYSYGIVFVTAEQYQFMRGGDWFFANVLTWIPLSLRVLTYNVRLISLTSELFDVAGYEQPYRKKVKMKLLLRELLQDEVIT
jgi:hypothetical protein